MSRAPRRYQQLHADFCGQHRWRQRHFAGHVHHLGNPHRVEGHPEHHFQRGRPRGLSAAPNGNFYWTGVQGSSWYANVSAGASTNWTTSVDGSSGDANFTPASYNTVNFSATSAGASPIVTTLDQNFSVAGINVLASGTGAVTINQAGAIPSLYGTLTLGSGGITVNAGTRADHH